jgi:hypothetical protein
VRYDVQCVCVWTFCSIESTTQHHSYIIHPLFIMYSSFLFSSVHNLFRWKVRWNKWVVVALLYTCLKTPVDVAFTPHNPRTAPFIPLLYSPLGPFCLLCFPFTAFSSLPSPHASASLSPPLRYLLFTAYDSLLSSLALLLPPVHQSATSD